MAADKYKRNAKWHNVFYVDHWRYNDSIAACQRHAMAFCNLVELAACQQSMKVRADLIDMDNTKMTPLVERKIEVPKIFLD